MKLLAVLVFALSVSTVSAQGRSTKIAIYVDHSGLDPVGIAYVYEVKEAIRRSAGYRLALTDDQAPVLLHIVTIDGGGRNAVVAVALTANTTPEGFLSVWAVSVGSERVAMMGHQMIADIDKTLADVRLALPPK